MMALPLVLMTEEEVASFGRSDGGFGALQTDRGLLPLTAMDVDARVSGVIASIEIAQTFINTTGDPIEATYIFPLPDRAAVHRFRMEVGGRVIEGVVEERGAAREQYDQAIATGHRAAITEEERPGTFTLRVGNLMPGELAAIRISLVGPLPVDDGEVTFRFPLVVAPRYMPGTGLGGEQAGRGTAEDTTLVPDASRISPPVMLPGCHNPVRLGLRVAFEDGTTSEIASSLHAVTTTLRDVRVIEARPGERLDRDFILRWKIAGNQLRSTLVCADDSDGTGTFMLTFVPPTTQTVQAKPRDVMFVLDRSGSMDGWKMVAARRALARMIDTLTSRDQFSVIAFDDQVEQFPERAIVSATDRNRYRAVESLAQIDSRGGTELAAPLRAAVAALAGGHDDRQRVVVLVTDGQVGNEDDILREVTPHLRNVRMFTLGIDQAVNAGFLRRLAGAGGGLCELVESEDRLDAVMAKVHRRIGTPIATDLALQATGFEIDLSSITPSKLPDVYAGAPVVVFGRYRGTAPTTAKLAVTGTSIGEPLQLTIAREGQPSAPGCIAASWARAHIRELEDRYAAGMSSVEAEIVSTSKRFRVLSRFTAFLAIDRSAVVNAAGNLRQIVQPVESPAGWNQARAKAAMPARMGGMHRSAPMSARSMSAQSMHAPIGQPPPGPRWSEPADAGPTKVMQPGGYAPQPMSPPPQSAKPGEHDFEQLRAVDLDPTSNYRVSLTALANELAAKASIIEPMAIRMIRQRLIEWIEDVRSIGGQDSLASEVEALVHRLAAALSSTTELGIEAAAVAVELARIANSRFAPKPQRPAFWK